MNALLFFAAISAASSAASSAVLTPDDKEPLALIVTAPSGSAQSISSSELIGAVSAVLERFTDLSARVAPPELVEECKGAVSCLASRAGAEVKDAHLLLVLSLLPGAEGDSAAALLVDLDRAAEAAPLVRAALKTSADANAFIASLFTGAFKPVLEARGHFEPYAELDLVNELAVATLRVDGEAKGTIGAGTTTLRLRSGARTIGLEADGHAPWTSTIVLARGAQARLAAHLSELPSTAHSPVRTGLLWAGAGFGATGAAIAVYALAKRDGAVNTLCLHGPGDPALACGSGSRFITPRYDPGAAIDGRARLNPGGLMLAPLGMAVASCGLTWSLSMLLFDEDRDPPWLELAAGIGAGVITYGIAALANGTPAP